MLARLDHFNAVLITIPNISPMAQPVRQCLVWVIACLVKLSKCMSLIVLAQTLNKKLDRLY